MFILLFVDKNKEKHYMILSSQEEVGKEVQRLEPSGYRNVPTVQMKKFPPMKFSVVKAFDCKVVFQASVTWDKDQFPIPHPDKHD